MVSLDRMQIHFSSLLLDANRKQKATASVSFNTTSFSLVTDNAIAPAKIKSIPRRAAMMRTKSTGGARFSQGQGSRKKIPKRTLSAPMRFPSCCTASRWKPESSHDVNCSKILKGTHGKCHSTTNRSLNLHRTKLLPRFRGAVPTHYKVIAADYQ